MIAFGKELRRLRRAADMTQEELAEQANIGQRYIGQLESGSINPSLLTILKLAKGLNTTPENLVLPVWAKMKKKL